MGLFTTPIKNLDDLFVHTLKDIYYAENQITKALPKMIDKANNSSLKSGLQHHLQETKEQISRLEQVFSEIGQPAQGVTCEAIDGIIAEAEQVMSDIDDATVLDVGMACSAQAVEHYEISRYGSLIALAKQLGHESQVVPLLAKTLEEEKAADRKLTQISETELNQKAA